ncbi:MAG: YebC/PmpR family DNA-binding transcriptional regulator, partial [Ruminiclostridium sp.]|nr:YebC/PmpR family DNA-binding transcriptional regulator [Ruminiclostridium sp.]
SFLFSTKGVVVLDNEDGAIDEDKAMEDILEAGGDDFSFEDGCVEIVTDPNTAAEVGNALSAKGYTVLSAEAAQIPSTYTALTDEEHIKKMGLLLDALDDNDDVQNVYHNWEE